MFPLFSISSTHYRSPGLTSLLDLEVAGKHQPFPRQSQLNLDVYQRTECDKQEKIQHFNDKKHKMHKYFLCNISKLSTVYTSPNYTHNSSTIAFNQQYHKLYWELRIHISWLTEKRTQMPMMLGLVLEQGAGIQNKWRDQTKFFSTSR